VYGLFEGHGESCQGQQIDLREWPCDNGQDSEKRLLFSACKACSRATFMMNFVGRN